MTHSRPSPPFGNPNGLLQRHQEVYASDKSVLANGLLTEARALVNTWRFTAKGFASVRAAAKLRDFAVDLRKSNEVAGLGFSKKSN